MNGIGVGHQPNFYENPANCQLLLLFALYVFDTNTLDESLTFYLNGLVFKKYRQVLGIFKLVREN